MQTKHLAEKLAQRSAPSGACCQLAIPFPNLRALRKELNVTLLLGFHRLITRRRRRRYRATGTALSNALRPNQ
jgi:hypothetical protein